MRRCIERKRDGEALSASDWHAIVRGYMNGGVDEAQMAALCMACVLRGMTLDEAFALTQAVVASGERLAFDRSVGVVADKHSSGGVSDIVSLAAVPLAAATGARVAKLSGRALGHTGGTIDKLETIAGLRTSLTSEEFIRQVETIGCAIASQSASIVPADKRLYALRDRTGSVPSLGLIAASIVGKKVAGGADAFVFDVKTGAGAFVREPDSAAELARVLIDIAGRFERRATAFVTDMNEPLGRCIGTGVEVVEAKLLLEGAGDARAVELVTTIASTLAQECGVTSPAQAVAKALQSGRGYEKFCEMVAAQGGDVAAFERMRLRAPSGVVLAGEQGYVGGIDVVRLGNAGRALSSRDPLAGLRVLVRVGDAVEREMPLLEVFGADDENVVRTLQDAFAIVHAPPPGRPLIYEKLVNSVRYPQSNTADAL